jgi:adenosine deaminase
MATFRSVCCLAALAIWLPAIDPAAAEDGMTEKVAVKFEHLRDDPLRLRAFLSVMPKGGDLHNHLDGAIYAETFLARASKDGLCIDIAALAIRHPPCDDHQPRADEALAKQPGLENAMIDSLSMRDFVPSTVDRSSHDHFFATFEKFHAAAADNGATLVEEARRAAAEHVDYLEIIWIPAVRDAIKLGLSAAWHGDDFAADAAPIATGIQNLVSQARHIVDAAEAEKSATLGCATPTPEPACKVVIRYQTFSLRTVPPQAVFAQMAYDFAVAKADPRFVGVNIVAPEDDPVALRDYTLHMRMLRFFHEANPQVKLSLHAGELAFGLVPPEALTFHIRQAVEIAGASRIGHGVSVMYEDDPAGLLAEMAQRKVAVEINQTSNQQILGVSGPQHPFAEYRAAGVPVVISTDDEGVERTDLTQEFARAAETWHLGYKDLKALARASILYSFLPGAPSADGPGKPDNALLAASEKARVQWKLEQELDAFEKDISRQQ